MPSLDRIKPISYFKANAAEMLAELRESGEPYVITQNGEAAAVLMDTHEYDKLQERLIMLQLLNMSERDFKEGRTVSVDELKTRIAKHHAQRRKK